MNKIKEIFSSKERIMTFVFCVACFIVVMFAQTEPLFPLRESILGHDFAYHYLRTEALAYKIRDGAFFTGGIDYLFNNGAGYASSTAYPDFLLFIPALLRVAGIPICYCMSIFVILCSVLTYLNTFICVKGITKSPVCASMACSLSMLTFYRIDNIYTRFALGEIQAFIFWPLIIYGLYNLVAEDFKKPYFLGIGIAGMILTHTISTAISLGLCVLVVLIYIREMFRSPKKILMVIITAAATVAVTAYYWLPLIEFLNSCELVYQYPYTLSEFNKVAFFDLFRDMNIIGIGIMLFIFQLPRFLLLRNSEIRKSLEEKYENYRTILKFADVCLILGLLMVFMSSDLAPWSVLKHVLNFMQFPWRLHGASTTLLSISAAFYIYSLLKHADLRHIGMTVVMLAACMNLSVHADAMNYMKWYSLDEAHYKKAETTFDIGFGEWLPVTAKRALDENEEDYRSRTSLLVTDSGENLSYSRGAGILTFDIPENHCEYADVPFIWYKGYKASDSTGRELEVTSSDKGFVRVDTSSAEGTVEVRFQTSPLSIISSVISVVSVSGLVVLGVIRLVKRKKAGIRTNEKSTA